MLRGPQGTLYGAGSMGGTVKLVTNAPNLKEFEGEAEGIGSGTSGGGLQLHRQSHAQHSADRGTVALRLVGTDKYVDGWIKRIVEHGDFPVPTGRGPCGAGWAGCTRGNVAAATPTAVVPRVNWERLQGGRAELLAQPSDALKIDVLAMYQRITMGDYDEYDLPPGIPNEHFQPFNLFEPFFDEFRLYGLTVNYDLSLRAAHERDRLLLARGEPDFGRIRGAVQRRRPVRHEPPDVLPDPIQRDRLDPPVERGAAPRLDGQRPLPVDRRPVLRNFESIFTEYNASVPLALHRGGRCGGESLGDHLPGAQSLSRQVVCRVRRGHLGVHRRAQAHRRPQVLQVRQPRGRGDLRLRDRFGECRETFNSFTAVEQRREPEGDTRPTSRPRISRSTAPSRAASGPAASISRSRPRSAPPTRRPTGRTTSGTTRWARRRGCSTGG